MRSNPYVLPLVLIGVCATCLGVGFWAMVQQPFMQRSRLPDGTVVTLEAATYGKQHGFVPRTWWQKLLRPFLPRELQPHRSHGANTRQEALVFWISARSPSPASASGGERLRPLRFELELPPGAKRLDLTFIVQKIHFVEFLATPSQP